MIAFKNSQYEVNYTYCAPSKIHKSQRKLREAKKQKNLYGVIMPPLRATYRNNEYENVSFLSSQMKSRKFHYVILLKGEEIQQASIDG